LVTFLFVFVMVVSAREAEHRAPSLEPSPDKATHLRFWGSADDDFFDRRVDFLGGAVGRARESASSRRKGASSRGEAADTRADDAF
jgi:hypothetical protein